MKTKYAGILAYGLLGILAACGTGVPNSPVVSLSGVVEGSEAQLTLQGLPIDASMATITLDGESTTIKSLQPGVLLSGTAERDRDRIRLHTVEIQYRAKGVIDDVSLSESYVDVVGIRARVNALTNLYEENPDGSFTKLTLADLEAGDYINVTGVPQTDDSILATRIEKKLIQPTNPDYNKVALRVNVRELDKMAYTFTYGLRTYRVDYKNASLQGALEPDVLVRVQGVRSGSSILASKVQVMEAWPTLQPGARVELGGPIGNLDETGKSFVLMGFSVNYTTAQVTGTLKNGVWVKVEGTLGTNRVVQASKVEVRYEHGGSGRYNGQLEGPVSAVDPAQLTLRIQNRTFWADQNTLVLRNQTQARFSDIRAGDWAEVSFDTTRADGAGNAYAARVQLKQNAPNEQLELKGIIADFNTTIRTFSINGVPVAVIDTTKYEIGDLLVTADEFWNTDRTGALAELKGVLKGSVFEAHKVELE
ncbi:DUF5666 domain-containing protein [Meiothermus hypogaeus]|uniref:DUF5666 domain-containing protein n=2 Tax=Meiothermus hypogaeus TaxID=884155 RepID=A0A511R3V9_9DEIN|nr:DUF5666 domain-containing protein [Meiothermus hypogaeus]RIH77812.1 hypothetical protein Mhypo_01842 [Meiothermus hypogaeus]GEM83987.1 hypothetical protein MHY01S_21530 [Meiothermus hypogaeus NBRC 106114]